MVRESSEEKVSDEQGSFRGGPGCVVQVFTVKQLMDKVCEKDSTLFITFIDL